LLKLKSAGPQVDNEGLFLGHQRTVADRAVGRKYVDGAKLWTETGTHGHSPFPSPPPQMEPPFPLGLGDSDWQNRLSRTTVRVLQINSDEAVTLRDSLIAEGLF
jgi:hypothetical protein